MALTTLERHLAYLESKTPGDTYFIYGALWALSAHCLSIHDLERATHYGRRCLNTAKSWQHLYTICGADKKLAEIRLQLGQVQEAAGHVLDCLDWHLAIGQVWQTLGAIFSVLLEFTPLFGGGETAVPILSMVHHHPEAIPLYRELIAAALPRLEAEVGSETFAAAWERGKTLDFDTAVAHMRAILSD